MKLVFTAGQCVVQKRQNLSPCVAIHGPEVGTRRSLQHATSTEHFAALTLNRFGANFSVLALEWATISLADGLTRWPPFFSRALQIEISRRPFFAIFGPHSGRSKNELHHGVPCGMLCNHISLAENRWGNLTYALVRPTLQRTVIISRSQIKSHFVAFAEGP